MVINQGSLQPQLNPPPTYLFAGCGYCFPIAGPFILLSASSMLQEVTLLLPPPPLPVETAVAPAAPSLLKDQQQLFAFCLPILSKESATPHFCGGVFPNCLLSDASIWTCS
ncbi:hypothetical protein KIL84_007304 [Mauremys mutica]|uniref:Uncharacterized protein n=1 Tax=Mauremys mutica TaxID=74926 RepID=A0A9D3X2J8_9SAUR|nr:hypothetical protein KIL84_007304 [Mauremys mutica]